MTDVGVPLFSYQSLMSVVTGTPRDENGRRVLGCSESGAAGEPDSGSGAGMTDWVAFRLFSYQSLMPVVTGTPRDENGRRVLAA